MSNLHNEMCLEHLHEEIIEQDKKGLLDDEIDTIANVNNLHPDDDRDEILQFITENIFYNHGEAIQDIYRDVPKHLQHLNKDKLKSLFTIFSGRL